MSLYAVIGSQWGDEGKGRIIDNLAKKMDFVARYAGGPNAGHTVIINSTKYILHHVPSGIFNKNNHCVIGNGVVINLFEIDKEIKELNDKGIETEGRILISERAHLIMPYHQVLDYVKNEKIGTTVRGIGPTYADKIERKGIRFIDILDENVFREKLFSAIDEKTQLLQKIYGVDNKKLKEILKQVFLNKNKDSNYMRFFDEENGFNKENIFKEFFELGKKYVKYIVNTTYLLDKAITDNKQILVEGAQGVLLDLDVGTYPFVTSSNSASGGIATGLGIGLRNFNEIIGVVKAYTTRVGNGPFPTELKDETGERLTEKGKEFGSTTGRKRRCGWLDTVICTYSIATSNITSIALTKLDVLDSENKIKICTAYKHNGKTTTEFPTLSKTLKEVEPVYTKLDGWEKDTSQIREFSKLPENAQAYVKKIEELLNKPIKLISIGPERDQIIIKEKII